MFEPAGLDLVVQRNSPFPSGPGHEWAIADDGAPMVLTGRTLTMQVRQYEGEPGAPLINLSSAAAEGDRIEIFDSDKFRIHIAQATHEGLPASKPKGPPLSLVYDLRIDGQVYFGGSYTVRPGVTR